MNEGNAGTEAHDDTGQVVQRSWWFLWDVPVLGYLLLFGAVELGFSVVSYIGGQRNEGGLAFMAVVLLVLQLPLAGICLLLALIRILAFWPRHVRNRKKLRRLQVGAILALLVCLGLPFTGLLPPGYKTYTWGFRRYVRAHADIPAMRTWLSALDPNTCEGLFIEIGADESGGSSPELTEADLPASVLDLRPRFVELFLDEGRRPAVRLLWGSGMLGTWGLTVGHEAMEVPPTQPTTKDIMPNGQVFYDYGQYRLPLSPGVYVWHDLE